MGGMNSTLLALVTKVERLKAELKAAQAELLTMIGVDGASATSAAPRTKRGAQSASGRAPHGSVADGVRKALASGPRAFGEIAARVGGNKTTIKSALNKGRERGEFFFADGVYGMKKDEPKKKTPSRPAKAKRGSGAVPDGVAATSVA